MAQCDVQTLMTEAKCFLCLTPGQMQLAKLALLCDVLGGNVWYSDSLPADATNINADPDVIISGGP